MSCPSYPFSSSSFGENSSSAGFTPDDLEEQRHSSTDGVDSDLDDTISSLCDTNTSEGNYNVGADYSVDDSAVAVDSAAGYSVDAVNFGVDYSVDHVAESVDTAKSDTFSSIFAQSYFEVMKKLSSFKEQKEHQHSHKVTEPTPSHRETEATNSSVDTEPKVKPHNNWYMRHPPSNTSDSDPGQSRKARWLTLLLPLLFIGIILGIGGGVIAYSKKDGSDSSSPEPWSPAIPDGTQTDPVVATDNSDEAESGMNSTDETETVAPMDSAGETAAVPEEIEMDSAGETETTPEETLAAPEKNVGCDTEVAVSCEAHFNQGCVTDGLYWVSPEGVGNDSEPFQVYCDQTTTVLGIKGGWSLFLNNNIDQQLLVEEPVLPATSGGLMDEHWVGLRDNMATGIMVTDENGEVAFIAKEKLQAANCWTPWSIPSLVPSADSGFIGLVIGQGDKIKSFSLFRAEKGSCNLLGEDFCTLRVGGLNETMGNGPYNFCEGWDVFPSGNWSYEKKVLYYIR